MTAGTTRSTGGRTGGRPYAEFLDRLRERDVADVRELDLDLSLTIAEIDDCLKQQVEAILHHPDFKALESAWSSLEYLLSQAPADSKVIVRVLNVSRDELSNDFEDTREFDQSTLFRLVYEEEFGLFGGEPFALLIANFEFGPDPEDIDLLRGLGEVSAAAHAVTLTGAAPDLLGFENWTELSRRAVPVQSLPGWTRLRELEDSRYLALLLPRVLLRLPYRRDDPDRRMGLRENAWTTERRLWGNAAFALAQRAMTAFAETGWCTAIRGLHEGWGVAQGLPQDSFGTDAPGRAVRPPVDVVISDSQERALVEQGLIPLCRVARTPDVAFFSLPTLHQPPEVDDPSVRVSLLLSSQLPYILAASRFAHYLKCQMRDRVGRFVNADAVQRQLSAWLNKYTLNDDRATKARQAEFPLRHYEVSIRERARHPGHLEAIVYLQPHYQVEDPNVMVRLAVELPDPDKTRR